MDLDADKILEVINSIIYQKSKVYQRDYNYDFREVQKKCLNNYIHFLNDCNVDTEIINTVKKICKKYINLQNR